MKQLYNTTRLLANKQLRSKEPIKDKHGNPLLNRRWQLFQNKILYVDLWRKSHEEAMENVIQVRKYEWLGHSLRRSNTISFRLEVPKPGRQRTTWRIAIEILEKKRTEDKSRVWLKTGSDEEILSSSFVPQGIKRVQYSIINDDQISSSVQKAV
ncbi:hypothetical protein HHI36_020556 [Cryptolaemus montrouzieri]|uniref:Uncharacterized protein n=1 Tax=Cryptolaemus montrouzieri TaxID=559131 RepID=A0ABD2NB11_9CUCU